MSKKEFPTMLTVNKASQILDILSLLEREIMGIFGNELIAEAAIIESQREELDNTLTEPSRALDEIPF